ncbi:MAG: esterase/lipase family protein, partial [Stenotrophobium sp.]
MTEGVHVQAADVHGYSKLAVDATVKLTDLVEAMHLNISRAPWIFGKTAQGRTRGITGLVYASIRGVTEVVGLGLDQAFKPLVPLVETCFPGHQSSLAREAVVAAVNGVLGDHLEASGNPLALTMRFRRNGRALMLHPQALQVEIPDASGKLLVLVHGLCMNDLQWTDGSGYSHADALARSLGYTPIHLHYNSGKHISTNGREFAEQLELLLQQWPVPVRELTLLTHSLGGLLARSACHYGAQAGHGWLRSLKNIVFLGTPHHGAPLERGGNRLQASVGITPYTAPRARLG